MESYETLSEAINGLREEGYTEDFNLNRQGLILKGGVLSLIHDEFQIDKYFRFEGNTDPSDESIVYAISGLKHHVKGILVNGYGIYTETVTNEMAEKLKP
ncbi:MAG: phosphoribosylpyrophosphate synthetase [Bacteroidota bacterium]